MWVGPDCPHTEGRTPSRQEKKNYGHPEPRRVALADVNLVSALDRAWWHRPTTLAFGRLRRKGLSEVFLSCRRRPWSPDRKSQR